MTDYTQHSDGSAIVMVPTGVFDAVGGLVALLERAHAEQART